jgi:hypothetical protein
MGKVTAMSPVVRRMPWPAARSASCWKKSLYSALLRVLDLPDPLALASATQRGYRG